MNLRKYSQSFFFLFMSFLYSDLSGPEWAGGHAGTADIHCRWGCLENRVCVQWWRCGVPNEHKPALAQSSSECTEERGITSRRLQLYWDEATGASGPCPSYWTHAVVYEGQQCCSCRGTMLCSLCSKDCPIYYLILFGIFLKSIQGSW